MRFSDKDCFLEVTWDYVIDLALASSKSGSDKTCPWDLAEYPVVVCFPDIIGRKGCDCSICNGVNNKLSGIVGNKAHEDSGGKSSCNICERRKEMLRMERERQKKLQKCPFEILGASNIKGKSSQEVFDEFRELIIPSQNGFFDMMRGIVKTMHVSSEAELKWAKEKEAKELAKKKEEELKKMREASLNKGKEELVNLQHPISPKVTVVLKQTPCGQILAPSEPVNTDGVPTGKRLPKDISDGILNIPEEEISYLQPIEFTANDQEDFNYLNINSKENQLHSDLIDQMVGYNMWSTASTPETTEDSELDTDILTLNEEFNLVEQSTESPFVKFVGNDELKTQWKSSRNSADDFDISFDSLPTDNREDLQKVAENFQSIDNSVNSNLRSD